MLFWGDPVTPAEEFRYITTHMLLPILGVVAAVAVITVILIAVLRNINRK